MYFHYREKLRNRFWGIAILCVLVLFAILGAPRIDDIHPISDSTLVPSTASIRITFNQPMDHVSVETRITIVPPMAGRFEWEGNSLHFIPETTWSPGSDVKIDLAAGSRSSYFLPMLKSHHWSFRVGLPRILFLTSDANGSALEFQTVDHEEKTLLLQSPFDILDFSVSPDGTLVSYSIARQDGGTDLRVIDLLSEEDRLIHECPSPMKCQNPRLSPDNDLMVYEQIELQAGTGGKWLEGLPQIMSIKLTEGSQTMMVGSINHAHSDPHWSSRGKLAYYDETSKEILLVDLTIQSVPTVLHSIPSDLGMVGSWSPDEEFFIYPDVVILDETYRKNEVTGDEFPQFYSHIYQLDLSIGMVSDLTNSGFGLVEDAFPVYSPNGYWIAFTRKYLDDQRWSLGRQLWLMRSDGSEARPITQDPEYNHFSISWSPDSSFLTFVRVDQNDLTQPPEVWLYDLERNSPELFATAGYLPQWIP